MGNGELFSSPVPSSPSSVRPLLTTRVISFLPWSILLSRRCAERRERERRCKRKKRNRERRALALPAPQQSSADRGLPSLSEVLDG
jgi:hypothetical protein